MLKDSRVVHSLIDFSGQLGPKEPYYCLQVEGRNMYNFLIVSLLLCFYLTCW